MRLHRFLTALAAWVAVLCLAAPVLAGTPEQPEVTDPAGDQAYDRGDLVGVIPLIEALGFNDTDVLRAWVTEDAGAVSVAVETAAAGTETTLMNVSFAIAPGPGSVAGSTADGTRHHLNATGMTLADGAPAGATVERAGNVTYFNFTRDSVGASGGDELQDLVIETSNSDDNGTDPPFTADDQSASDRAPDEGTAATTYTFERPAPVPGVEVEIRGGSIQETVDGATQTRGFTGDTVETPDDAATVDFDVVVRNTGTDADTFTLSVSGSLAGASATFSQDSVTIGAGDEETVRLTVALDGQSGQLAPQVQVVGASGASDAAAATITIEAGPAPTTTTTPAPTATTAPPPTDAGGRDPILDVPPLRDLAESSGLDDVFGDWAEVFLLAIALLILVLIVWLVLFLATRGPLGLDVTPGSDTAGPGDTAEFAVEVRNRKKRALQARLHFDADDPTWRTGVLLTQDEGATLDPLTSSDEELEFTLNGREDPGARYHGTLRVRVPETARDGDVNRITLGVVPVDEEGEERRRKARFRQVKVRSSLAAKVPEPEVVPNVRLAEVTHEPVQPEPGETVTTEARLENDDPDKTWVMKVVLNVDGEDLQDQIVAVPPRKARAVIFTWQAGSDEHRVRVLVYEKAPEEKV